MADKGNITGQGLRLLVPLEVLLQLLRLCAHLLDALRAALVHPTPLFRILLRVLQVLRVARF